jgi:hypothetical protein
MALNTDAQAYTVSGLTVASDLVLPGLLPITQPTAMPDVVIRAGALPARLADPSASGPNWEMADGRFRLEVPGIVAMLLIEGREIVYCLAAASTPDDAAVFVSGTGFGILLHQRGRVVLHASAVRIRDRAVLLCGPSGAGKSTLAAALVDRGHALVSDDFCAIAMPSDGPPLVEPDGRQMKLWQNAIDWLALAARRCDPVRPALRKYYVEPRAAAPRAIAIGAIYILRESRPPLVSGIAAPNIVDAAVLLRRNAYRPAMVRRMDQKDLYFRATAAIVQHAGLFTLTRALDFAAMPATIAALEAHWRDLGITERAA